VNLNTRYQQKIQQVISGKYQAIQDFSTIFTPLITPDTGIELLYEIKWRFRT